MNNVYWNIGFYTTGQERTNRIDTEYKFTKKYREEFSRG